MNQSNVLERLIVEVAGDDSKLKKSLQDALKAARDTAQQMEQAFKKTDVGDALTDVDVALKVVRESTGQFTRDYTTAVEAAGRSTEKIAQDVENLNAEMKANHDAVRQGEQSREAYRKNLEAQRANLQNLIGEYNRAARGLGDYSNTVGGAATETKDLDDTIKGLSQQVRTQRNLWASRISDDEQFRQGTEKLHQEMHTRMQNTDLTADQMRKLTGDLAYAQRGLDSVNNVASRGGLAWTAQIGIADAFGNSLRGLGPAGNIAAQGVRSAQMGFAALGTPISLADLNLKGFVVNLGRVAKMLPLLASAVSDQLATSLLVGCVAHKWASQRFTRQSIWLT